MPQVDQKEKAKPMHFEDLAALKEVSEETVLSELQNRHFDGLSYTFVGDVLLYVNPNRDEPLYEKKVIFQLQIIAYSVIYCVTLFNSLNHHYYLIFINL